MRSAPVPDEATEGVLAVLGLTGQSPPRRRSRSRVALVTAGALAMSAAALLAAPPGPFRGWIVLAGLRAIAQQTGTGAAERAAPGVPTPARAFAGDARMERKVSLGYKDKPLGELTVELGKQLGVKLIAARAVSDDKVTAFVGGRSSAEALDRIAGHLGFRWYRIGDGYELRQDPAERAREAALREEDLRRQFSLLQARLDRMERFVSLSPQQVRVRLDAAIAQIRSPQVSPEARAELMADAAALEGLQKPGSRAALAIYRAVTLDQVRSLIADGVLRLSSEDSSLLPHLAAAVHDVILEKWRQNGGRESHAAGAYSRFDELPPADARVTLRLERVSSGRLGPSMSDALVQFGVTFQAGRGAGREYAPDAYGWSVQPVSAPTAPPQPESHSPDPELEREVTLALAPALRPQPKRNDVVAASFFDGGWPTDVRLSDVAEAVHRASGLDVIADSFIRARVPRALLEDRKSLAKLLDGFAPNLRYSWRKADRLLTFRNRWYYLDRPTEVPERIVRPWRERVVQTGTPTLDDLADLALALTDEQCRGMQDNWGWYLENPRTWITRPHPPAGIYDTRHHFRFWGTLLPPQRRLLLAGGMLPVARMTATQRTAWVAALTAPDDQGRPALSLPVVPATVGTGAFALNSGPQTWQQYEGTTPDGRRTGAAVTADGPEPEPSPKLPGLENVQLKPHGPTVHMHRLLFRYYLGSTEKPARAVEVRVPVSPRKRPEDRG